MKTFITFAAGETYEKLSEVLKDSINSFSKYDLVIYRPEDFDIKWEPENWQHSYVFIFKVLSCLKALETYDEIVWLDNDCLVTNKIDRIWNNVITTYPLLPIERFNNFYIWPNIKPNYCDMSFLNDAKNRIGVIDSNFDNIYVQACCMLFNKNCLYFFEEVYLHYQNFDSSVYPYGDESIINCLIWRDKLSNLGDIFLCSYYFSDYTIQGALTSNNEEEYFKNFDINHREEGIDEDNFILSHGWNLARHNRIGLINNNFNNLLFLHGSKDYNLHNKYLNTLKEWIDK
jgi:hypothetical protein